MDQISKYSSAIEDHLSTHTTMIKPHVPLIARFLIVVTFIEDSLRIMTQWSDQLYYLENYQNIPWGLSHLFLILNVVLMVSGSGMVLGKRYTTIAVGMLFSVIVIQSIGYGLILDPGFLFRNLSVMGGLMMVLSEAVAKKKDLFAGLPQLSETEKSTYLQLAGRILLVALFFSFLFGGEMTWFRLIMVLVGFGVSVMVVLGLKAKTSALVLIVVLSIGNVILNNWWTLHENHPHRDFRKYDFFQILSVMGGLLLLFNLGPGGFSLDERKKTF